MLNFNTTPLSRDCFQRGQISKHVLAQLLTNQYGQSNRCYVVSCYDAYPVLPDAYAVYDTCQYEPAMPSTKELSRLET